MTTKYLHVRDELRNPVATIAYRTVSTGFIDLGIAYCNPKDSFSRKMGRTIAEGRLDKKPTMIRREPDEKPLAAIFRWLSIDDHLRV